MMAGVVAMASVIEDFDTQPCKKLRKDGGSPVVKTITNYFPPVPKPVEKPFSPPRTNNIMDYFVRKAPTKTSSPEQLKDNCQKSQPDEKCSHSEAAVKRPSQRRGRKASKIARKLVEAETVCSTDEEGCVLVEKPHDKRDAAVEADSSDGVLSSDTTAQLVRLNPKPCIKELTTDINATQTVKEKDGHHEDDSKNGKNVKLNPGLDIIELSPIVPSRDKSKLVKTVEQTSRKKQQTEVKPLDPGEKETESSLCDVSMEVNVDEASQLNNSTVTISFEEFVRSQSQEDSGEEDIINKQETEDEGKITSLAQEMDMNPSDDPKAEANVGPQISPRTVTFQAEVHAVSPKQEPAAVGKLASIFNRRKGTSSPEVAGSPSHTEAGRQLSSTSMTVKWKSNVVLHEEDLELAVLESESTAKSSEAERKQFMAAFKQASLDGSKSKPVKSKQKQPEEKVLDDADRVADEDAVIPTSTEQEPTGCRDKKAARKKPSGKGRKKAKKEEEAVIPSPAAVEETVTTTVEVDEKREDPPLTSTPSAPVVRRSRREAVVRQTPKANPTTPVRKTRQRGESEDTAAASASPAKIRKSKHGVFLAQMVCPPDAKQSPIRIKFIRVPKSVPATKALSGCSPNTLASNTSNKKRKQAKKLVEKARVIQQSKKAAAEEKGNLRRSSRTEASAKKSYCEDEDSVICLEEDLTATPQTATGKSRSHKSLRSLNDVLGKASPVCKETKPVPGSKLASLGQEKNARRVSAVISIFDESSREASENSQDDEQFRARREFLKSGLPESFKKQIAKTTATKEAYSLSCSSFQPVIHMKQPPTDCPLWSLQWPQSALLCHLQEVWWRTSNPLPSVCDSLCVKTEPTHRGLYEPGSGLRSELSESVRQLLTEEVRSFNPSFPLEMFIAGFLKRRSDHQQQQRTASEAVTSSRVTSSALAPEPVGGKRKRIDDEEEVTVKVAKKQRANASKQKICPADPEPTKRAGRMRRAQRSRPEEEAAASDEAKPSVEATPVSSKDNAVVVLLEDDSGKKDAVKEDTLWTDKYQPQHSSDIVGNTASVRRLHSWLKEWKLRTDREERKKQAEKKREEGSNDSDWDCGEEDSQEGEDTCNTVLITGPTGVGKTAAVYACAQELGFKVFEVNASSQRSGRLILSQLKEATQSHQVDSQGVNAHKPSYFTSYGTSAGPVRPGSSPRKVNSPRRVVSSPRKHPQSPRGAKRGGLAPTSLANFFKMGRPTNKETPNTHTAASKSVTKASECAAKHKDPAVNSPTAAPPKEKNNEEQSKKTATSLILFEEVDVIFDDDSGFLAAIKTFMTTTKRPVILTTSDPAFSTMFDGNFEEINFKAPSVLDAGSFLQLLCLTEDIRTDQRDISSLLKLNGCDMRQSLLQLQFWTRSGGGRRRTARPLSRTGKNAELKPETEGASCAATVPSHLPPCDTGCTESMLGLLNIAPDRDSWELLRSCSPERALCAELLTNSRRRGVDLLYSNMERLLPLPLTQLATSTYRQQQPAPLSQDNSSLSQDELASTCLQVDTQPSHARVLHMSESADCSDDGSPVKVSSRMRKTKRRHCLPDQDGLRSDSDSEDGFLSLRKPQSTTQTKAEVKRSLVSEKMKRRPLTPEERRKNIPVSQCLDSMADFFDNMSYMDSSLYAPPESGNGHGRTLPVGAVVKDGMTDESRVEMDRWGWMRGGRAWEIPAAVEALSFHKCCVSVAEVWDTAQQLEEGLRKEATAELTLPVAAHCDGYSFTQDSPCEPQLVQCRREEMENLMFRGVFGPLSNRPAAALDYLPTLRTICRSEQLKEQGKVKRRFLHYLDAIHLGLEKNTLQQLAEDFP